MGRAGILFTLRSMRSHELPSRLATWMTILPRATQVPALLRWVLLCCTAARTSGVPAVEIAGFLEGRPQYCSLWRTVSASPKLTSFPLSLCPLLKLYAQRCARPAPPHPLAVLGFAPAIPPSFTRRSKWRLDAESDC